MFNVLFYVIGYNSRHLNKKEHIWRKIGLKQIVELRLQSRAFCEIEENKIVALRLQLGKVEAAAPDSKITKNTFMNFLFTPLRLILQP